jgi:hypothetical protein
MIGPNGPWTPQCDVFGPIMDDHWLERREVARRWRAGRAPTHRGRSAPEYRSDITFPDRVRAAGTWPLFLDAVRAGTHHTRHSTRAGPYPRRDVCSFG